MALDLTSKIAFWETGSLQGTTYFSPDVELKFKSMNEGLGSGCKPLILETLRGINHKPDIALNKAEILRGYKKGLNFA